MRGSRAAKWTSEVGCRALMQVTHERWIEAELHRVRGDLLAWMGEQTSSELCFQESLAVARSQNAKTWELRTSISLARIWSNSGNRIEARNPRTQPEVGTLGSISHHRDVGELGILRGHDRSIRGVSEIALRSSIATSREVSNLCPGSQHSADISAQQWYIARSGTIKRRRRHETLL
jgi:hypothetical protein